MLYSFHDLIKYAVVTSLLGCYSYQIGAYVILPANRIILEEKEKTKSIELINKSKDPHLVQLKIKPYSFNEKENAEQAELKAPFFISPPLFVLQGEQKQKVRVTLTSKAELPKDRESVFSFNFLEIPSDQAIQTSSQMKYSIDNGVKLFYRPNGIKGQIKDLPKSLVFSLKSKAGKPYLTINNQTGYHASFEHTALFIDEKQVPLKEHLMVTPYSKIKLPLPKGTSLTHSQIKYTLINDYGGRDEYIAELTNSK